MAKDFDKHPSASTWLTFKYRMEKVKKAIEDKDHSLDVCEVHRERDMFVDTVETAINFMNVRREVYLRTGK